MNAPRAHTDGERVPGRALLRLAGVFTQVACAGCLLLGTIAFVFIQQNNSDGTGLAIGWAAGALVGLVFGGLMVRGGLISLLASALLDAGFGIVLLVIDDDALTSILRLLDRDDIATISDGLVGGGVAMIIVAGLCLLAIPQAVRYGRWLHASVSREFAAAGSTERGFPPPPISAAMTGSMWRAPAAPPAERRSRRRMYFALAGLAIGLGAGIGVIVSSTSRTREPRHATGSGAVATGETAGTRVTDAGSGSASSGSAGSGTASFGSAGSGSASLGSAGSGSANSGSANSGSASSGSASSGSASSGSASSGSASATNVGSGSAGVSGSLLVPRPAGTVVSLIAAQRSAIGRGDRAALLATLAPTAVGFGTQADGVAIGRDAIAAQLERDLPADPGGKVTFTYEHVGEAAGHSWVALQIQFAGASGKREIALTELIGPVAGSWRVVAWHWGRQVSDARAENAAVLGTKPMPKAIANQLHGPKELDSAVRSAFSSRSQFAAARSGRDDAFNFGSGPNERLVGGEGIRKLFSRLTSDMRLHDGVHVVAASVWDPSQRDPIVGCALVNVDYTERTRASTPLTHTFRVLAVLVREGPTWSLVLTHWSHGGPIR